jgi:hypothetical protein
MDSLPIDVIHLILSYNRNFVVRNGKLYTIGRLDMSKYNLDIPIKKYVTKSYLLSFNCKYGCIVQFKNKKHRLYYKEDDEIEIIFESLYHHDGNLIVLWDSYFIE